MNKVLLTRSSFLERLYIYSKDTITAFLTFIEQIYLY